MKAKPTRLVYQSSLLHNFYIHRCGFSTRIQWWIFHSKRTRNEDTGDFITFPELILFVYFKTPEFTAGQEFPKRQVNNIQPSQMVKKKSESRKPVTPSPSFATVASNSSLFVSTDLVFPELSQKNDLECRAILDNQILVIDVRVCSLYFGLHVDLFLPSRTFSLQPNVRRSHSSLTNYRSN